MEPNAISNHWTQAEREHWLRTIVPAPLNFSQGYGTATLDDGLALAVSSTFAEHDSGLVLSDAAESAEVSVRCELLIVARTKPEELLPALAGARSLCAQHPGALPAQPGTLLPAIYPEHNLSHGLLIAPFLWGGPTPHLRAEHELVVICQLIMLSDSEYAYAVEEGVAAFQAGVLSSGIDLFDWER